jgi:hypothetical protein
MVYRWEEFHLRWEENTGYAIIALDETIEANGSAARKLNIKKGACFLIRVLELGKGKVLVQILILSVHTPFCMLMGHLEGIRYVDY